MTAVEKHRDVGGCINDGLVCWLCVYAAQRQVCAGANLQAILFFIKDFQGRWKS